MFVRLDSLDSPFPPISNMKAVCGFFQTIVFSFDVHRQRPLPAPTPFFRLVLLSIRFSLAVSSLRNLSPCRVHIVSH